MLNLVVNTYDEACEAVVQLGILPLSGFIPAHPSLDSLTPHDAWHTGTQTDPWLWRDRFATDGIAAYGRFIAGKPLFVSRELFPLLRCLLNPPVSIDARYAAGKLAGSSQRLYEIVSEHDGIDVRTLRLAANMQYKADKNAFDRALIDLQSTADIVISGITARLNTQGQKSGWNSTCYMLAERWMALHGVPALMLTPEQARTQFLAWIEQRWEADAVRYLAKKCDQHVGWIAEFVS